MRARSAIGSLAALGLGTLLALGAAEGLLRLRAGTTDYRVLPAEVRAEFQPAPGLMPGIEGLSVYTTNADGIRGRPYNEGGIDLLAIGGSTTECLYLDDSEAWPALLEGHLRKALRRDVWVGNVGASGVGAAEHVLVVRHLIPQLRPDWVLVLVGINDLMPVIRKAERYRPESEDPDRYDRFLDRSFHARPLVDPTIERAFPGNLAVWNLGLRGYGVLRRWRKAKLGDGDMRVEDRAGRNYERRREILRAAEKISELPPLEPGLRVYERNLREMVERIRAEGAEVVFATQPSVWNEGLSPEMERLLWMGFRGDNDRPEARYRPGDLERAMEAFNDVTRQVCRSSQARCIDLAREMRDARREDYYYDDAHFNELGSRRVAEILAGPLAEWLAREP